MKDYNQFQDEDGCPDTVGYDSFGDSDFDGVTDNVDQCLNARETYNRYQDEDGCPDTIPDNKLTADSDEDGYPDYLDSCPNSTRNFQWN